MDYATENLDRLDMARVLIKTSSVEFINNTRRIQINKESLTIIIMEESCECAAIEKARDKWEPCSANEDYDTENLDESFIPPSVASMEDEGMRRIIKDNYWHLSQEAEKSNNDKVLEAEEEGMKDYNNNTTFEDRLQRNNSTEAINEMGEYVATRQVGNNVYEGNKNCVSQVDSEHPFTESLFGLASKSNPIRDSVGPTINKVLMADVSNKNL